MLLKLETQYIFKIENGANWMFSYLNRTMSLFKLAQETLHKGLPRLKGIKPGYIYRGSTK
ncbi:hypothetical protein SY85_18300 [Flavisolibacter tropicus]|uniref:Uncharacterized protein n=1 Tax=Flavisolibacter tropicus TaxID=1492898 RepID=A0A172TZE9_9BACT|nr:hypothetical protein SY85_18300 [Flavisolibacter tropicus]